MLIHAAVRTVLGGAVVAPPLVLPLLIHRLRPAASTTTGGGLARVRSRFDFALRCLGIDLAVSSAARVPREGGLFLMWNQESHLDHLVLPVAIPRPFFSLFNNELGRFPVYGA